MLQRNKVDTKRDRAGGDETGLEVSEPDALSRAMLPNIYVVLAHDGSI